MGPHSFIHSFTQSLTRGGGGRRGNLEEELPAGTLTSWTQACDVVMPTFTSHPQAHKLILIHSLIHSLSHVCPVILILGLSDMAERRITI